MHLGRKPEWAINAGRWCTTGYYRLTAALKVLLSTSVVFWGCIEALSICVREHQILKISVPGL